MLIFTEEKPTKSLSLASSPSGELAWRITSLPDWLTAEPEEGVINHDIVDIQLTASLLTTAEPGAYEGKIEIISSGGVAEVAVQVQISPNPVLSLTQNVLSFGEADDTAMLGLSNKGKGKLSWSIPNVDSSLSVEPSSGELVTGQSVEVKVTAKRTGLPVGKTIRSLSITSNSKAGNVTVPVTISVAAVPVLSVSESRLKFPRKQSDDKFTITNTGTGKLTWSITSSEPWITTSPPAGELGPGATVEVTASIDRSKLPSEGGTGTVTVQSNSASGDITLPVAVSNSSVADSDLWVLDHRVVDAEYNLKADIIVTISADPMQLNIIDPALGTIEHVALPMTPNCVSIRPDGAYAAVGHNGNVSYVDLTKRAVERTYPVTTDALDIILPDNGWVYVFPRTDQWASIRGIDLKTGLEVGHEGSPIYAGTLARLHPSGDYIYGANNGLSPSDFEKYDVRSGGAAKIMYDSPYHGDYDFNGNVWISEDGGRLFARSGNVFRSSAAAAEDLLYAGNLVGASGILSLVTSTEAKRIFVLDGGTFREPPSPGLRVYDEGFLNYKGTVELPKFSISSGTQAASDGQFVFTDSAAEHVYVLVRAAQSSGIAQDWAIATFDMSKMP